MIALFKVPKWLWQQRLELRWLCGETLGIDIFQVSLKILKGITVFSIYDIFLAASNRAKQKTSAWFRHSLYSFSLLPCVPPHACLTPKFTYFQVIVLKNILCCCLVAKLWPALLWPRGLYPTKNLYPWDFRGKSVGAGCHFLLYPKIYLWTCNSYDWKQSNKNFVQEN